MYSTTIVAVLINLIVQVLPYFGIVDIGTEQLTNAVQVIVALGTGIWIWYNRLHLKKVGSTAESDVKLSGVKK